jgi:hypothetical protein
MGLCLMMTPYLYGKIPVEIESDIWTGSLSLVLVKTVMIWLVRIPMHIHLYAFMYKFHAFLSVCFCL